MAPRTTPSVWELRNAEDAQLLEAGDHATLLATYYEVILGRCLARLRNEDDAYEVAHRVIERLIGELARGKTYSVPYSVVVNKVIDWKVVEFFERAALPRFPRIGTSSTETIPTGPSRSGSRWSGCSPRFRAARARWRRSTWGG